MLITSVLTCLLGSYDETEKSMFLYLQVSIVRTETTNDQIHLNFFDHHFNTIQLQSIICWIIFLISTSQFLLELKHQK